MRAIGKLTFICSAAFIAGLIPGGPALAQDCEGVQLTGDEFHIECAGLGLAPIDETTREHLGVTFGPGTVGITPIIAEPFGKGREQLHYNPRTGKFFTTPRTEEEWRIYHRSQAPFRKKELENELAGLRERRSNIIAEGYSMSAYSPDTPGLLELLAQLEKQKNELDQRIAAIENDISEIDKLLSAPAPAAYVPPEGYANLEKLFGQIFGETEAPDVYSARRAVENARSVFIENEKLYMNKKHQWEIDQGWIDPETQLYTIPLPEDPAEHFISTPEGVVLWATVKDAWAGLKLAYTALEDAQAEAAGRTPAHQSDVEGVDSDIDSVVDDLQGIVVLVPGN